MAFRGVEVVCSRNVESPRGLKIIQIDLCRVKFCVFVNVSLDDNEGRIEGEVSEEW